MPTSDARAALRTYNRALLSARAEIVEKILATKQRTGAFYYEVPPLLWPNDLIVGVEAEGFSADLVDDNDTLNLYDWATRKKYGPSHVLRVCWTEAQAVNFHPEMLDPKRGPLVSLVLRGIQYVCSRISNRK